MSNSQKKCLTKNVVFILMLFIGITLEAQTTHTVINTNDTGTGSLRAAADSAVAGDIIRFNSSLIASGSDTITLTTGEIAFGTKGIIIKGLYNATDTLSISGNNSSRIFSFYGAGRVVLDSLTLVNGNGVGTGFSGCGGAVYRHNGYDTLFITNSIISGNTVTGGNGGGVYSYSTSNSASSPSSSLVSVSNSTISGNTVTGGSGGGIYSYNSYSSSSLVSVSNSTISGNTASSSGGGISSVSYYAYSTSLVSVSNSMITGNTASTWGGGVSSNSSTSYSSSSVSVSNSTISGNTSSGGGGIYSSSSISSSVSVINSTISGNSASYGGGIYSNSLASSSSVSVSISTISGNTSSTKGGGIYSSADSSSSVSVNNSTISGNTALGSISGLGSGGGGIYSNSADSSSSVSVSNSTISGNTATTGNGGGISSTSAASSSLVSVSNSTISANTAPSGNGGGISSLASTSSLSLITVTSSIIAENGSNSSGIYNNQTPTITSGGYNVFSDTLLGTIGYDSTSVTTAQLNLQALAFNGGATQTMLPGVGSIAIENGNPNDISDAQNGPIYGVREIGAAETCFAVSSSIYVTECSLYTVGNFTYTQSGVYVDTLSTVCGADSVVTLNLTINYPTNVTITETACNYYTSPSGNYVWTNSNTYMDTISNALNCDSIITINLTINNPTTATISQTACDSYTSPSGNYVWTSSNTYMDTIPNAVNCDSIITINLTINNSGQLTDVISACNTYTWIDGVNYTSSNNTATKQYTNANGCDSILTLDLTINTTQYATAVISACESYTWNGVVYNASNNTAKDTLVSVAGCDSIVTLDLTILPSSLGTEVVSTCNSYTWNGTTYTTSNNTAQDTLVNAVGCDSLVTLDLTILNPSQFTDEITSCTPITWIDGIVYNQTTNSPTYVILNSNGCDSVVTLDLTILEVDTTVTRNYLTLTAQATNATYQWIDCNNGAMTGETNASFTATVNGSYQVAVTQNGCVDTSACFTIANVGVQDIELIGVNLYPNPTSDVLNIDKGSNTSLEITITNSVGAVVYQSNTQNQITTISMAKMAMGMYVVTMKNELGVKVEKVVKR